MTGEGNPKGLKVLCRKGPVIGLAFGLGSAAGEVHGRPRIEGLQRKPSHLDNHSRWFLEGHIFVAEQHAGGWANLQAL